jgi:hypothetical protein
MFSSVCLRLLELAQLCPQKMQIVSCDLEILSAYHFTFDLSTIRLKYSVDQNFV